MVHLPQRGLCMFDNQDGGITHDSIRAYVRCLIWRKTLNFLPIMLVAAFLQASLVTAPPFLFWFITALVVVSATGLGEQLGMAWKTSKTFRVAGFSISSVAVVPVFTLVGMRFGLSSKQWALALLGAIFSLFFWSSFCFVSKFFHLSPQELTAIQADKKKLAHPYW